MVQGSTIAVSVFLVFVLLVIGAVFIFSFFSRADIIKNQVAASTCSSVDDCEFLNKTINGIGVSYMCDNGICKIKPGNQCSNSNECSSYSPRCLNPYYPNPLITNGYIKITDVKVCVINDGTEYALTTLNNGPGDAVPFLNSNENNLIRTTCDNTGYLIVDPLESFLCKIKINSFRTCTSTYDCEIPSLCLGSSKTCGLLPLGDKCELDKFNFEPCITDNCATNLVGKPANSSRKSGICQPPKLLNGDVGTVCQSNSDCVSQNCQSLPDNGQLKFCVRSPNDPLDLYLTNCSTGSCIGYTECNSQNFNPSKCFLKTIQTLTGTDSNVSCPPYYELDGTDCKKPIIFPLPYIDMTVCPDSSGYVLYNFEDAIIPVAENITGTGFYPSISKELKGRLGVSISTINSNNIAYRAYESKSFLFYCYTANDDNTILNFFAANLSNSGAINSYLIDTAIPKVQNQGVIPALSMYIPEILLDSSQFGPVTLYCNILYKPTGSEDYVLTIFSPSVSVSPDSDVPSPYVIGSPVNINFGTQQYGLINGPNTGLTNVILAFTNDGYIVGYRKKGGIVLTASFIFVNTFNLSTKAPTPIIIVEFPQTLALDNTTITNMKVFKLSTAATDSTEYVLISSNEDTNNDNTILNVYNFNYDDTTKSITSVTLNYSLETTDSSYTIFNNFTNIVDFSYIFIDLNNSTENNQAFIKLLCFNDTPSAAYKIFLIPYIKIRKTFMEDEVRVEPIIINGSDEGSARDNFKLNSGNYFLSSRNCISA